MSLRSPGWALLALALGAGAVRAAPELAPSDVLPPVVGVAASVRIADGDTLVDVAARERVPFDLLVRLNPGVKVWIPEPGTRVELPTRYVLPAAAGVPEGLLVNVPEMRLYDLRTMPPRPYAIAVGDALDPTPVGSYVIGERRVHPAWRVPASIRAKRPHLPAVVAPGPDNPLGSRWLSLGATTYGIHGTNVAWSIGRMATHGCIRLYEDDMVELYERTPSGTRVTIVYEPVKVGLSGGDVHLEIHPDLYGQVPDLHAGVRARLGALGLLHAVDPALVDRAVVEARGTPVRVGSVPVPVATSSAAPPHDS